VCENMFKLTLSSFFIEIVHFMNFEFIVYEVVLCFVFSSQFAHYQPPCFEHM